MKCMRLAIRYYANASGRSQPRDFLDSIETRYSVQAYADIEAVAEHLDRAPVSMKPIKGRRYLYEIRVGGYRVFYFVRRQTLWVLHACRKSDQLRGIEAASRRLQEIMGCSHD